MSSSRVKWSHERVARRPSAWRPTNLTLAEYGRPDTPESNWYVTASDSSSPSPTVIPSVFTGCRYGAGLRSHDDEPATATTAAFKRPHSRGGASRSDGRGRVE